MKISLIPQVGNETVHCSQGDTNRQWQFELYGDKKIDIVDSPNPTYWIDKGGTEEILPTNTSVPSTSPVKCDIQYTDGLRTDQEFVYRESPTTVDGSAKLKSIYGNTIVWNQLVQNGNFADTSNWTVGGGTLSVSNNEATITFTSSGDRPFYQAISKKTEGHKVLVSLFAKASTNKYLYVYWGSVLKSNIPLTTTKTWVSFISTVGSGNTNFNLSIANAVADETVTYSNVQLFDLTAMFGSTKADEIYAMEQSESGSGVAYFRSLFPLPYYQYGQKLLSFNGSGIKTVGKNLADLSYFADEYVTYENGVLTGAMNRLANKTIPIPFGKQATIQAKAYTDGNQGTTGWGLYIGFRYSDGTAERARWSNDTSSYTYGTITSDSNKTPIELYFGYGASGQNIWHIKELQLEFGDTATSYTEYIESTTSIPTSTYFPTGMKSAGSVYDELTNNKATTRVGSVDLGSLAWSYYSTPQRFVAVVSDAVLTGTSALANAVCEKYNLVIWANMVNDTSVNNAYAMGNSGGVAYVTIRDTSYTLASDFTTAMNGVMLQYELVTPTETNITSATMVTEYGESDLDSNGVVICNEGMSKYSGFHDAKIRVSDGDGDVYSAKFQVHVERKPK